MRALVEEVEADVSRLIVYVNDEVVPEVRRGSSRGLRMVAEQLGRLAEQMDRGAASADSTGRPRDGEAGRPTTRTGDWQ
jgi:hypothetical protein